MASHTLHLHIRQAVKADKPERNYITLEQFLAWYREHPFPLHYTKGARKVGGCTCMHAI